MSYSTNNPASNETSKVLLEFKIKIKGLLPGGYQTSPCVSLTAEMLLTVTHTYLLPAVSTIRNPDFYYSPLSKSGVLIFALFWSKCGAGSARPGAPQHVKRRSLRRMAPTITKRRNEQLPGRRPTANRFHPRGRRSPGKR